MGQFPEPALETALTWVDKMALSTVEGLREKMEHVGGDPPPSPGPVVASALQQVPEHGKHEGLRSVC